jgi:hypothetical protein
MRAMAAVKLKSATYAWSLDDMGSDAEWLAALAPDRYFRGWAWG